MVHFTKEELAEAVKNSNNITEVSRFMKRCLSGNSFLTIKKYIKLWDIDNSHFLNISDLKKKNLNHEAIPLKNILIENSSYNRSRLKNRLYKSGLKHPICELCGQDENWITGKMSLILDHINGISNDNRLENLRIVCPNCNATLPTHCGKNSSLVRRAEKIKNCSTGKKVDTTKKTLFKISIPKLRKRKVERPPLEVLLREINELNYVKVGKKYGVSDNAVRKWIKSYLRELELLGVVESNNDELVQSQS